MMNPTQTAKRAMLLTLSFDVLAAGVAMALALTGRWLVSGHVPPGFAVLLAFSSLTFAASAALAFYLLRIHRQVWRHMGLNDVVTILQAVGLTVLIFLPSVFVWNRLVGLPRSSLAIAVLLWVAALFIGRMIALSRSTHRPLQFFQRVSSEAPPAILLGDAESAARVISNLRKANGGAKLRLLGLLQTDSAQPGRAIRGVPVLGSVQDLEFVLKLLETRYGKMPWVAVTGEARTPARMEATLEVVARLKSKIIAMPSQSDSSDIKAVRTADLLSRPQRALDMRPVEVLVRDGCVLVTGGGGSIGLELARQCAALGPRHLVLLDSSEYNLYRADFLIRRDFPDVELTSVLGNVRNAARLRQTFSEMRPDVVLHAAALKHVPLMEDHACEAILTNVQGAMNVARLSAEYGVDRFVFISTDKAVDPDNVMGATKRLAELVVSATARETGLSAALVRFGNVLGSSGSVVPLFREQIDAGGPVTVTHPNAMRYFMTVEEAAALVLQAGALVQAPDESGLFVLDMGDPVRIESLAESMIRLRGLVPGVDIQIVHTGLRSGEKLTECLTYDHEELEPCSVDGVLQVKGGVETPEGFELALRGLMRAADRCDEAEALGLLAKLLPEFACRRVLDIGEVARA